MKKWKILKTVFAVLALTELLLWRAGPDNPIYQQDCTIFFTQLNNVNNEIKSKVLPTYVKFSCCEVAGKY